METNVTLLDGERLDVVNENITLIQKKSGLTFGTDALLLAAFARGGGGGVAADLGAGTGIVSFLAAARGKFTKLYAVEEQPDFWNVIRRNAVVKLMENRVFCVEQDVRALRATDLGGECDAVLTNPPYMRAGSGKTNDHGAKAIARHELLWGIGDFCAAAGRCLKYGGSFYAVYRPERMAELFRAMQDAGIEPKRLVAVCPDAERAPSLILVEGKKGAAAGLRFEKPLFLYADAAHTVYTEETKFIYENGRFKERA